MRAGKPLLSVHFKDTCYIVDHIKCLTPCESHHKKTQPRCVIRTMAREVIFSDLGNGQKLATITN